MHVLSERHESTIMSQLVMKCYLSFMVPFLFYFEFLKNEAYIYMIDK